MPRGFVFGGAINSGSDPYVSYLQLRDGHVPPQNLLVEAGPPAGPAQRHHVFLIEDA